LPNFEDLAFLNVNVPDLERKELKGMKATTLGKRNSPEPHREVVSDKGVSHCWLGGVGSFVKLQDDSSFFDHQCVAQGYASITPIKAEWIHQPYIKACDQWLNS